MDLVVQTAEGETQPNIILQSTYNDYHLCQIDFNMQGLIRIWKMWLENK